MEIKKPNDGKPKMDFEIKVKLNKEKILSGVEMSKTFFHKITDIIEKKIKTK